jgi:hypothetical protein
MRMTKRDELLNVIAQAQQSLAALELVPEYDCYHRGDMVRTTVRYRGGREFTYLLLKIVLTDQETKHVDRYGRPLPTHVWYCTGYRGPLSWDELMRYLTDNRDVVAWEKLVVWQGDPVPTRAHEDVKADLLDILRHEYGVGGSLEALHVRVIDKLLNVDGIELAVTDPTHP